MFRGKFWTMRQYAGFGSAEETNRRFRYLLEKGQTGLSIAFDLPTQMGYDSDHAMAEGEVGRVGVAIDSIDDFRILMKGIPLDKVSTSMTINATAAILLAMYAGARRGDRRPARQDLGHDSERHSQGVLRPRHLHLPPRSLDADRHRHIRLVPRPHSPVEHDQHQRLPYSRGGIDGRSGDRLHPFGRGVVRRSRDRRGACRSTISRRASPSSSACTTTSSRRSRSSARRGASGPGS